MHLKEIINLIDTTYLSNNAKERIIDKFDSDQYKFWNQITKNKIIESKKLLNDSTGQNLAFTYVQDLTEKTESANFLDLFYVQKSYLGPFVTFYVLSRVYRNIGDEKMIMYSDNIICESKGKFKTYFDENWNYLKSHYPDLIYIPFGLLNIIPNNAKNYKLKQNCNIYELLFGLSLIHI